MHGIRRALMQWGFLALWLVMCIVGILLMPVIFLVQTFRPLNGQEFGQVNLRQHGTVSSSAEGSVGVERKRMTFWRMVELEWRVRIIAAVAGLSAILAVLLIGAAVGTLMTVL